MEEKEVEFSNEEKVFWYSFGGYAIVQAGFILLRLLNIIDWPWLFVLSPLLFPLGLIGVLLIFCFILSIFSGEC